MLTRRFGGRNRQITPGIATHYEREARDANQRICVFECHPFETPTSHVCDPQLNQSIDTEFRRDLRGHESEDLVSARLLAANNALRNSLGYANSVNPGRHDAARITRALARWKKPAHVQTLQIVIAPRDANR